VLPREDNFFAQFGTLVHTCLEKYFAGELEAFELSKYFNREYHSVVTSPAPMFGMEENYKKQGLEYFDNFTFEKEDYEVVNVEDQINFTVDGIEVTARPDLILKNLETLKTSLCDYKTAVPFKTDKRTGKVTPDKHKMDGYYKQMYIYAYALRQAKNIHIDIIDLWFPRAGRTIQIPWKQEEEDASILWLTDNIKKIKEDNTFFYNNKNPFFCNNLCSVRKFCEYR